MVLEPLKYIYAVFFSSQWAGRHLVTSLYSLYRAKHEKCVVLTMPLPLLLLVGLQRDVEKRNTLDMFRMYYIL